MNRRDFLKMCGVGAASVFLPFKIKAKPSYFSPKVISDCVAQAKKPSPILFTQADAKTVEVWAKYFFRETQGIWGDSILTGNEEMLCLKMKET